MLLNKYFVIIIIMFHVAVLSSCNSLNKNENPEEVVNSFLKNLSMNKCVQAKRQLSDKEQTEIQLGLCHETLNKKYSFFNNYLKSFKWEVVNVSVTNSMAEVELIMKGPFSLYNTVWKSFFNNIKLSDRVNSSNIGQYFNRYFQNILSMHKFKNEEKALNISLVKDTKGKWKIDSINDYYDFLHDRFKEFLKIDKSANIAVEQVDRGNIENKRELMYALKESILKLNELYENMIGYNDDLWFALSQKHTLMLMVVLKKMRCEESIEWLENIKVQEEINKSIDNKVKECKKMRLHEDRIKCLHEQYKTVEE